MDFVFLLIGKVVYLIQCIEPKMAILILPLTWIINLNYSSLP